LEREDKNNPKMIAITVTDQNQSEVYIKLSKGTE
jgi:hypothetical protein